VHVEEDVGAQVLAHARHHGRANCQVGDKVAVLRLIFLVFNGGERASASPAAAASVSAAAEKGCSLLALVVVVVRGVRARAE